MEIISIEAKTFEAMLSGFERFAGRMEAFCRLHEEKEETRWIDNQEVCLLLNISPRTLQSLREKGTLPYSQICHKTYYKYSDVQRLVVVNDNLSGQAGEGVKKT